MSQSSKKKATSKKAKPAKKKAKPKVAKKAVVEEPSPAKEIPKKTAKAKKPIEKKEAPAIPVTAEPIVLGPAPGPKVYSRHIDAMHERPGRGFSFGELASSGVALETARRQGVSIDVRRRSVLAENVETLKGWAMGVGNAPAETRPVATAPVAKKK